MEFVKPMLARVLKEGKDDAIWIDPEWIAEKKLDGHRILATSSICYSRLGTEKHINFIQSRLPDGMMLDGEVLRIDEQGNHSDVSHWLVEDQSVLKFVVFDILYYNGNSTMSLSLSLRRKILEKALYEVSAGVPDTRIYLSEAISENKKEWAKKLIDDGAEGVMLKNTKLPYGPGSRSGFVKYKWFKDYDVIIVDAEGYPSEWTVRPGEVGTDGILYPEGKKTAPWVAGYRNLRYGMIDEDLKELVVIGTLGVTGPKDKLEILYPKGCVAVVKAYGQYPSGALMHPVFQGIRDDKSSEECTFRFPR
ncbi:MAG: ATP-dependent DNA ligase [Nitrospirae bacterium]|nr:ATP-dependent DNA ligase [Nitrospirota bacterium]